MCLHRPLWVGAAVMQCYAGSLSLDEQGLNGIEGSEEEAAGVVATSEEHLLTGHTGAVVCVAMHEERLLFTGSTDCTIKVLPLLSAPHHPQCRGC